MNKNVFRRREIQSDTDRFIKKTAAGVLQERLQETLILELHENGNKEYKNMTLRELYASVMRVITQRPGAYDNVSSRRSIPTEEHFPTSELGAISEEASHSTSEQTNPSKLAESPEATTTPQTESMLRNRRRSRATSIDFSTLNRQSSTNPTQTTYRERLGGYLHPRDMRRLVTPFSSSNEPELIIRRHVILLNFDPLRAIVLRDRVLIFVPDGSDSLLIGLERRVFGGIQELENQVFGDLILKKTDQPPRSSAKILGWMNRNSNSEDLDVDGENTYYEETESDSWLSTLANDNEDEKDSEEVKNDEDDNDFLDEWDDIETRKWIDMAFELIAVDAVLQTVCAMMSDDAKNLIEEAKVTMSMLAGEVRNKEPIHVSQERLRIRKDEIKETEARVQGFIRAMNLVLDEDEDMALMNLSRLVTHPERFIQPVPEDILHEESDEPELILEAYLQQALSVVNALELTKGKIISTEELVLMKLDTVRNRLLLVNTVLSLVSLVVGSASLVGSLFGMNLLNGYEQNETMFLKVVYGTIFGGLVMLLLLCYVFYRAGSISGGIKGI